MPRGAFNTTCDLIFGPSGVWGPPGVVWAFACPCRLVVYDQIIGETALATFEAAWVTVDVQVPNGPYDQLVAPGQVLVDYYASDQLAIPSGGPATHYVMQVYLVSNGRDPVYYRANVAPLPYAF
jgi:hypothetical protein